MSVTEEIKSRIDLVEVISEYLPLRRSGSSYSGFCPFHPNTRTPAFAVFPNTQTWRCFGACAEGGDVFSFLMKKEGWDFRETLTHLAERTGVVLAERDPNDRVRQSAEDKLTDLLAASADYFHQLLLHAPQAEFARRYVSERGLTDETVSLFKIGYALDSWDACRNHFGMQGYSDQDLAEAGLLTVNEEKGRQYDRFRNRLMIPILSPQGRAVGFGARTLDPDGLPKYLNSPQTKVFDKSRLLFGLDQARRYVREARQVIIVEGYMDVMQAWQAGFRNVVAQMGTALTEAQLRLAKRYSKQFVLALDADAAGERATLRSLEVAREVLDREQDIRFDARGLVRHEGRLKADIRVVTLPEGTDPDKLIRTDPNTWLELIAQAKPIVAYVIDVVTEGLDMDDGKAKTAAAQQVLPLINDVGDPIEREHYRQMLARKLRVDERVLLQITAPAGRRRTRRQTSEPAGAPTAGKRVEAAGLAAAMRLKGEAGDLRRANFLRQCLSHPRILTQIDRKLALNKQAAVSELDFSRADDQAIWHHLRIQADLNPVATLDDLCDSLDDEILRDRIQELLNLQETPESELDRLPDVLVLSVLDWRLEQARGLINEVMQLFHESQEFSNSEMQEMYRQQLKDLPRQVLSLNRARQAVLELGPGSPGEAIDQQRDRERAD